MILTLHQAQYLPYLGYFDKIAAADSFVLLDKPQYEKNGYQNRNRIKGANGPLWLTVPVLTRGKSRQALGEVEINNAERWQRKHWLSLEMNYRKAPFWERYSAGLKPFYEKPWQKLAELNIALIRHLMEVLGLKTPVSVESETGSEGLSTERLVDLCKRMGAAGYLSGAGGKDYMDEALFAREKLELRYQHYRHPEYPQLFPAQGFVPNLCVLDLLFNVGPRALEILKN